MEETEIKALLIYRVHVGQLPQHRASELVKKEYEAFIEKIKLPNHIKVVAIPDKNGTTFEICNLGPNDLNVEELQTIIGDEKEQLINVRISKLEKSILLQNCKKKGFKTLSEYLRVTALADAKPNINIFEPTLLEPTRPYLFAIQTDNSEKLNDFDIKLTSLIRDINIEEDKIKLTFMLDDTNVWFDALKTKSCFKLIWLDKTGKPVNSFIIKNINRKVFPLKFSFDDTSSMAVAMAIFSYQFDEIL